MTGNVFQDSDIPPPVLAYEIQGRYAPGEEWVTLDVCSSRLVAVEEALFRRDPWGRVPTEMRVVAVRAGTTRAA